jgi:hypothetical protein
MHAYIHVLATVMQDAWRTRQCDVARVLRVDGVRYGAGGQAGTHGRTATKRNRPLILARVASIPAGAPLARVPYAVPARRPTGTTYVRPGSIDLLWSRNMYVCRRACPVCVRACACPRVAPLRVVMHIRTAEQHAVCARASNNAIGQRAIPATVVRAPTGRWLLPGMGCARSARAASPSKLAAAAALGSVVCARTSSSPRPVGRAVHYVVCVQFNSLPAARGRLDGRSLSLHASISR